MLTKVDDLSDGLARHPIGREVLSLGSKRRISERQALVDQIKALDTAEAKDWPRRDRAFTEAQKAWLVAQAAFQKANHEINAASSAKLNPGAVYQAQRDHLVAQLMATADRTAIDAFLSKMLDELDAARKLYVHEKISQTSEITREHFRGTNTNSVSLQRRVAAINEARDAAAALRLEPDQSVVPARLAELLAGLPAIDMTALPHAPK